jgi:hypothetical protein
LSSALVNRDGSARIEPIGDVVELIAEEMPAQV